MKRSKRQKVKQETSDVSTSRSCSEREHDLAYYIHDRVELMHQVFTVLKPKELKAMAPECVRHININDLQELCMEELLGISSKRLCAILDGAEPPSDTESSSESLPDKLETISLDSISSDDDILSQVSTKKSKKHKHRSKSKSKKKKSKDNVDEDREQEDKSRRAGLTMLELLELQARARAIRAQLQNEQAAALSTSQPSEQTGTGNSSDGEVEIKEETAEVVEISSEDEKPNVQKLEGKMAASEKEKKKEKETGDNMKIANSIKTVTKKVNDLIITVPQTNASRKIKLKRRNNSNTKSTEAIVEKDQNAAATMAAPVAGGTEKSGGNKNLNTIVSPKVTAADSNNTESCTNKTVEAATIDLPKTAKDKGKSKDKKKKRKKGNKQDKDGSDHDEITLQLSDTEKMDLLEDLEGKTCEMSSDTVDSSEDEGVRKISKKDLHKNKESSGNKISKRENIESKEESHKAAAHEADQVKSMEINVISDLKNTDSNCKVIEKTSYEDNDKQHLVDVDMETQESSIVSIIDKDNIESSNTTNVTETTDMPLKVCDLDKQQEMGENEHTLVDEEDPKAATSQEINSKKVDQEKGENKEIGTEVVESNVTDSLQSKGMHSQMNTEMSVVQSDCSSTSKENIIDGENVTENALDLGNNGDKNKEAGGEERNKEGLNEKSEGELSDRDSSEVEESELPPEVVCISDDEDEKRKKKKKDKKCKKGKKSKKNKDFCKKADQNFYTETLNEAKTSRPDEVILLSHTREEYSCESLDDSQDNLIMSEQNRSKTQNLKQTNAGLFRKSHFQNNTDNDEEIYEILELTDDSSCYEIEEISISKEPTADEIKALSAKIDEIERDKSTDLHDGERDDVGEKEKESNTDDEEHVSWKQRYLKSAKVKKVLTTANILNAMRKKNLDLKKKLHESKIESKINEEESIKAKLNLVEGSIQHYNTLQASTKYVDPVKEQEITENITTNTNNEADVTHDNVSTDTNKKDKAVSDKVTKEMKKEAKQLIKMYKMLLKYNDVTKEKDASKKKKKKKKTKDIDKSAANST